MSTVSNSVARCQCVLVVEDDKDIRECVQEALELEGYKVFTAENGKVGLEKLAQVPSPCLILLDLMMPVMDGWEFAKTMVQNSSFVQNPIVVVSAFSDKELGVKIEGRLKKPIDLEELTAKVGKFCA